MGSKVSASPLLKDEVQHALRFVSASLLNQYWSKYRMSGLEYAIMYYEQNEKCAVCEKPFIQTPHVDHCHLTNLVRGLLCSDCNHLLGYARDTPTTLDNAAHYLRTATLRNFRGK